MWVSLSTVGVKMLLAVGQRVIVEVVNRIDGTDKIEGILRGENDYAIKVEVGGKFLVIPWSNIKAVK